MWQRIYNDKIQIQPIIRNIEQGMVCCSLTALFPCCLLHPWRHELSSGGGMWQCCKWRWNITRDSLFHFITSSIINICHKSTSSRRASRWCKILVFQQCFIFSKCISSALCKSWCLPFKWMRIHHYWGWEPLWLFALAVQWINVVGGLCAGEIVNEILLSRAAWRRSRCRGAGVTTLFLLQPTPLQWSYAVEEWGEIPGVNPTYFHTLWTLCGHRPRFWARGQGTGLQPNCYHSFFTNWSGPPSYKYTHKSIFWHISNCSLLSLNSSLYLYPFPNPCERRRRRIVIKTKQIFVMTRIYILNFWSWIFNIHAHKL